MTWATRVRLLVGVVLILALCAALTLVLNRRISQATSTSATIRAQEVAVGTDYPGPVAEAPVAEGDTVVGRFTCSATHLGEWLGQAPTGRRFERVKEVWILRFRDGRIVHVWSLEDTLDRLRQLGLTDLHG